jgi:hypothetical protein
MFLTSALASVALAGCGGGAETVENPITTPATPAAYSGPAPATADVQAFRINVWDNLKAVNRCGQCHTQGGQAPAFVRTDMTRRSVARIVAATGRDDPAAHIAQHLRRNRLRDPLYDIPVVIDPVIARERHQTIILRRGNSSRLIISSSAQKALFSCAALLPAVS